MKGRVKFFNENKGFGFITADDNKEYFVHITGLKEGVSLNENDSVTFDIAQGDRGPKAINVELDTGSEQEQQEESQEDVQEESQEDSQEEPQEQEDEPAQEETQKENEE